MDLQALNSGPTPTQKGWLHPICGKITFGDGSGDTLSVNTVDFKTIETNSLTLVQQVSVPNPSVGAKTIYVASGTGLLTTQDSLGNSVPYLPTNGSGTMTGNLVMGPATEVEYKGDMLITSDTVGASVVVGNGTTSTLGSVAIGGGAAAAGNTQVVLGGGASATVAATFAVVAGRNAVASSSADVVVGQSASTTAGGGSSVVLGSSALSECKNSVALGRSSHCTVTGDQCLALGYLSVVSAGNGIAVGTSAGVTAGNGISIGFNAVNNDGNTCLIGSGGEIGRAHV
jgi:hypothetical protein